MKREGGRERERERERETDRERERERETDRETDRQRFNKITKKLCTFCIFFFPVVLESFTTFVQISYFFQQDTVTQ